MQNESQLIVSMYKNGIPISKISKIVGMTNSDVRKVLREFGELFHSTRFEERDRLVCEKYNSGMMITKIAKEFAIDRHTVTNILTKYGIYKENKNASNLSEEKRIRNNKIVELYQGGLPMSAVAKELKVCPGTVAKVLKAFGIKARPQHQPGHSRGRTKNRKYHFDLNYFEKIDTEEKAYWLGFLYADGYVCYRGVVTVGLAEKDLSHLELLRKCLGDETVKIPYTSRTKSYFIHFSSVKMADDLRKLGCVQKKSLVLKFPTEDQVPQSLVNHFMRGYFDGDGCLSNTDRSPCFSVLGTPQFLDEYEKILLNNVEKITKTKRIHRDSWNEQTEEIAYGGRNRIFEIYSYLYKDATIYLQRKKDKFDESNRRLKTKSLKS